MEVWALQWDYPCDMEHNITLWTDEMSALRQACTEIKQKIDGEWDMGEAFIEKAAKLFEESAVVDTIDSLRSALLVWNEFQNDFNDENGEWYSVTKYQVLGNSDIQGGCRPPPTVYKATAAGATCRGPCKTYNEYAYADQPDGTHMCHQCSTFQHIFGTKP
jgi:hypothetical protein